MTAETTPRSLIRSPLAVVGMECRLPGADGLDEFWELLRRGGSAIGELPPDRLDRDLYYSPVKGDRAMTYSTIGGVIGERPLDEALLGSVAAEWDRLDPCHVILVEVAARAWRHAGAEPGGRGRRVGVYVGHSAGSSLGGDLAFATLADDTADYLRDVEAFAALPGEVQDRLIVELAERMRRRRPRRKADGSPHTEANMAAAVVARALRADGPQVVVDAACASSLVALALAALDLQNGTVEAALVGAASYNRSDSLVLFSQARSCSATGSRPFDDAADGLVSSEGYVALVVKTLARARSDGDVVHAVVRGLGLASDGRGRSLWAPRREGQAAAVRRAYGPRIDARHVQYIEAHATSTQLGDATELEALADVFADGDSSRRPILLGSVKSNLGHTLEAAGLASLLKVVLAMKNRVIPPTVHIEEPNRAIPWSRLPFALATEPSEWPAGEASQPRRAAVNAFGIGGLNVHLVVDEDAGEGCACESHSTLQTEPIAVIGRGVILPGAQSIEQFAELIRNGRDVRSEAPPERWRTGAGPARSPAPRGGFIRDYRYAWETHRVPPRQIERANPLQFMLLDAASQALAEAGYDRKPFDRAHAAVVIGTVFGGEFGHQLQVGLRLPELRRELDDLLRREGVPPADIARVLEGYEETILRAKPALLDETGSFTSSTLASRIAKTFDLMGGALAIDAGDCSSTTALAAACQLLWSGACEVVLCGAAQRALDLPTYETLSLHGTLARVDDDHGYVPAEGVALVALKRLADARRDGDRVLATIRGIAAATDAGDLRSATETCMRRALEAARCAPSAVQRVVAGCRVPRLDGPQCSAAEAVYGRPAVPLPLLDQVGHLQAAHGLASLIHETISPCAPTDSGGSDEDASLVGLTTHGLNGLAQHVVLEVAPQPATSRREFARATPMAQPRAAAGSVRPRLVRLAGGSEDEFIVRLDTASRNARRLFETGGEPFRATDAMRLVVRAADPDALTGKLQAVLRTHRDALPREGLHDQEIVVHRCDGAPPRIAMIFPGQGSQYRGMARDVISASSAARARLAESDDILRRLGSRSFAEMAWEDAARLGADVWTTQVVMLLADLFWYEALLERRIRADYLCGHSYGEFAALVAAGAWTLEQAIRLTRARADAIATHCSPSAGLLAIGAASAEVTALIHASGLPVVVTHENAPEQTVVGGPQAAVEAFARFLAARRLGAHPLPVPCAFHTPLLQPAQEAWRTALLREPMQPPRIPMLSNATARFVAEPDEIREHLVRQLVEPVRYTALVQRLAEQSTGLYLEVGPRQVLTRLHRQILAGRESVCLPSDQHRCRPDDQLDWIQAVAECLGHPAPARGGHSSRLGLPTPRVEIGLAMIDDFDATAARRRRRREQGAALADDYDATSARRKRNRGTDGQSVGFAHPTAAVASPGAVPESQRTPDRRRTDLARFLVDFVVEQTGYPADVVTLDADLEADLGIDSIKKAQLFGELRELLELRPARDVALATIRTLRQILEFAETAPTQDDPTGAFAESRTTSVGDAAVPETAAPTGTQTGGTAQFLVSFVVEQTGYPPDVVTLDADLEADLGIDSIKKAQLFGELREHFGLDAAAGDRARLAGFRTLRDILALLGGSAGIPDDQSPIVETRTIGDSGQAPVVRRAVPAFIGPLAPPHGRTNGNGKFSRPSGPRYHAGLERGRREAARIRSLLRRAADTPTAALIDVEQVRARFTPDEQAELQGLADGAGVHVAGIMAYNVAECEATDSDDPAQLSGSRTAMDPVAPGPVTSRFVLRMQPAPQRPGVPAEPALAAAALILGDNEVGVALHSRCRAAGIEAHLLAPTDDPTEAVRALEQLWRRGPIPHLFLVSPRDPDAATTLDEATWRRRRSRGLLIPFWICQRWLQLVQAAGLMEDATLVAATSLGGDFGFSGRVVSAEGGGVAGLLKAIVMESWVGGHRTTPIKVIDMPPACAAEEIVEAIWRELAVPSYDVEIAWSGGERRAVRAVLKPLPDGAEARRLPSGTWVCTGGARGITAFVARQLALRYGLTLHLIGTSPVPEVPDNWRDLSDAALKRLKGEVMTSARAAGRSGLKEWQKVEKALEIDATLRTLAADGVRVTYHSCDVADRDRLGAVLDEIRSCDGPIRGVLHGAGIGQDARFDRKDPEKVDQCLGAKLDGALALMDLTRDDPLEHFVAFGSISGRFGANGHTDYSLANEMLAKQVDWYRQQRPEVAAVTFHWHAWGDVGMATRPETRLALESIGMQFMPAGEGLRHLIAELEAGAPEPEVLITDERYHRAFHPGETVATRHDVSAAALLGGESTRRQGEWHVTSLRLDPTADPFLAQHRLDDKPLLPLVIGLELFCEAAMRVTSASGGLRIRDVKALRGLTFHSEHPQTVRVRARDLGAASVQCELVADFQNRDGRVVDPDRVYLTGVVDFGAGDGATAVAPRPPDGPWRVVAYPPRGETFYAGPALQCLRKIQTRPGTAWGRVAAPALGELAGVSRPPGRWTVPAAALDACLHAVAHLAWEHIQPGATLPASLGRLDLHRLPYPGEPCLVEVRFRRREGRSGWFDFVLFGDNRELILAAADYELSWRLS